MPQTVVVLGAGASKEVGLPTGAELKTEIARMLDIRSDDFQEPRGDSRIVEALRLHVRPEPDIDPYLHAAVLIAQAMPQAMSIDNFIDNHRGDKKVEICGKLAIVLGILAAERRSIIYHEEKKGPPFPLAAGTWFNAFFQLLHDNCSPDDLEKRLSTVSLIVFNYDRCIEHYLYMAFQNYHDMLAERAATLVKRIHIYHPYGSVGALPWYGGANTAPFGHKPHAAELLNLAAGIKTFTEGMDPASSNITAIRAKILQADKLIFLGFRFHPLNLELLWQKGHRPSKAAGTLCFATGKGISISDAEAIKDDLIHLGALQKDYIKIAKDLTCSDLMSEYWRSLSLL